MLDYDGTLAPFQPRPERAVPYPGIREALESLIEIERQTSDKAIKKEIKRALFKLSQKGFATPEPKPDDLRK